MFSCDVVGVGRPVVLLHGLGSNKNAWKPQHELGFDRQLIIPDLRGHGQSQKNGDITMRNLATDIIELLDYLEVEKADIIGLSLGGAVAQEIYRRYENRVSSLVLANTFFYDVPFFSDLAFENRKHHLSRLSNEEYVDGIIADCFYNPDPAMIEEAREAFTINRDAYLKAARLALNVNNVDLLPVVKVPTLVIGSKQDRVTPALFSRQMHMLISGCKLVILEEAGHLSNIEKRKEFNQHVHQFLQEAEDYENVLYAGTCL